MVLFARNLVSKVIQCLIHTTLRSRNNLFSSMLSR